jgi:GNAT superfamily N-acetyltransferase
MEITAREIILTDSTAVTALTNQLGYLLSEEEVRRNMELVINSTAHSAFVAVHDQRVVGWIGVSQAIMIEFNPFCEINGLVVDEAFRGKGVGKILIEQAKQWTRTKENLTLRVRCNVKRKEAHLFYQKLGFKESKEQKVFDLEV